MRVGGPDDTPRGPQSADDAVFPEAIPSARFLPSPVFVGLNREIGVQRAEIHSAGECDPGRPHGLRRVERVGGPPGLLRQSYGGCEHDRGRLGRVSLVP